MRIKIVNRGRRLEQRQLVTPAPAGNEFIAHQGFSAVAPEQTLVAYAAAIGRAHSMECDVRFSSDGIAFLLHDDTVDRTSDLTGAITSLTAAALEAGDFGSWFDATRFAGVRIPRFEDWLGFVGSFSHLIYPEFKAGTAENVATMVQLIIAAGLEDRCVLQSFNGDTVFPLVRELSADITLGYLAGDLARHRELLPLAAADGNAVMLTQSNVITATPSLVPEARALGVDVAVWTVDLATTILALNEIGVYRIMSNTLPYPLEAK